MQRGFWQELICSHIFTMIFSWFFHDFPWFSHDFPMIFPWWSHDFPIFSQIFPWCSHDFPMVFLWFFYDLPIFSHVFPMFLSQIHRFTAPRHRELPRHQRGCNLLSCFGGPAGLLASASKDALVVSLAEMLGVLPRILRIYHYQRVYPLVMSNVENHRKMVIYPL